ncbi:MAG: formylglycine-generating enzyme family protein [Candidatus Latescibacterota bacterium]
MRGTVLPPGRLGLAAALLVLPAALAGQGEEGGQEPDMVYVEGYYIDRYEYPNRAGSLPRVEVSWEEARQLCAAAGKRLCTDSEWQRAAMGTQGYAYGYGPEFEPGRCNTPYEEDGAWRRDRGAAASGSFAGCTTPCGAADMIGNVWEWVDARYVPDKEWRVVRGGSWFNSVNMARADYRYGAFLEPTYRLDLIGFRCCQSGSGE